MPPALPCPALPCYGLFVPKGQEPTRARVGASRKTIKANSLGCLGTRNESHGLVSFTQTQPFPPARDGTGRDGKKWKGDATPWTARRGRSSAEKWKQQRVSSSGLLSSRFETARFEESQKAAGAPTFGGWVTMLAARPEKAIAAVRCGDRSVDGRTNGRGA